MIGRFVGAGLLPRFRPRLSACSLCDCCRGVGHCLNALERAHRHVEHPRRRVLQLDYVPDHL